jgi:multisubunit Na+/H+ antiporter MnhG subunit
MLNESWRGDDEQSRRVPPATTYIVAKPIAWRDPDGRPWDAGEHTHYSGPVAWRDPVFETRVMAPDGMDPGRARSLGLYVPPQPNERTWADRKLDELGEMFVTALTFLWLGSGALIYLLVGLLMIAVVVVVAPPVRLYLLARNAWRRSKPRSHGDFGDWNPW